MNEIEHKEKIKKEAIVNVARKVDVKPNVVFNQMEAIVDNIKMFSKKEENWNVLKLFKFFAFRYGIGISLAKQLCIYTGNHEYVQCRNVQLNYNLVKLKTLLLNNLSALDINLAYSMYLRRKYFVKISSYRGLRHFNRYPVRGQRTRSNAKTAKKEPYSFKLKRGKSALD
jgi:small subunit ribosomal protein S13